jgi:pimeloyl-ACP methyl ester carboxylesterase
MPRAQANGIELEYDIFGDPTHDPILLVMGLGTQMIGWTEPFCEAVVERGHHVIRFDNRDVGLSTKFENAQYDNAIQALQKGRAGQPVEAPYLLRDMAADAIGLLDHLHIERAHIVGASMGGMIVQSMAIEAPERVQSLTSIMSHTGEKGLRPPTPEAMQVLMTPAPAGRDAVIAQALETWKIIGSPGFPFDEARIRDRAQRSYDRCFHPAGTERQLVAITASGSRREALEQLDVPTLVIHGEDDPLVPVEGGRATLEAIPGAKGLFIEGMGHDMPVELYGTLADAITKHAKDHPTG